MSENNNENQTPSIEDLQAQIQQLADENAKIKSKNEELLNETKTAKQKAREREEAAQLASDEAARKSGDIESLDKSWQEKLSKRETELQSKIDLYQGNARKTHVEAVARKIASEISVAPDLILPHVLNRLDMQEADDGSFKTVVKDGSGNLSALTTQELAEEFKTNPAFQTVMIGTKASGGGANGGSTGTVKKGSKADLIQRNKAAFQKAGII